MEQKTHINGCYYRGNTVELNIFQWSFVGATTKHFPNYSTSGYWATVEYQPVLEDEESCMTLTFRIEKYSQDSIRHYFRDYFFQVLIPELTKLLFKENMSIQEAEDFISFLDCLYLWVVRASTDGYTFISEESFIKYINLLYSQAASMHLAWDKDLTPWLDWD
jgi:hypothetical protein